MHHRVFKLIRIVACAAVLIASIGCGLFSPEPEATPAQPSATAPAVAPAAPAAPAPSGGACSRIAACCRAYVNAMGAAVPASTCDAYNNVAGMPDSTCASAIAGYRSGLGAMNKSIPSECN